MSYICRLCSEIRYACYAAAAAGKPKLRCSHTSRRRTRWRCLQFDCKCHKTPAWVAVLAVSTRLRFGIGKIVGIEIAGGISCSHMYDDQFLFGPYWETHHLSTSLACTASDNGASARQDLGEDTTRLAIGSGCQSAQATIVLMSQQNTALGLVRTMSGMWWPNIGLFGYFRIVCSSD